MTPEEEIKARLSDRMWRLENLYYIVDKRGEKVKFKLNDAQREFLEGAWYLNLILKARQLGFTTLICILFLDVALFNSNTHCGIIAHTRDDAEEFFANKVKFAYDNLPSWLKSQRAAPSDSAKKLAFSNGSSIRVGTSLRSGTFQYLHISEFGKICARFPEKAREIVTGALNTVQAGQYIVIESTAEGREGYFYDYCKQAIAREQSGKDLNSLQFKFHFFPWWRDPAYELDPRRTAIGSEHKKYFEDLESKGIHLTERQKAWYVEKSATQQDDMLREYPSTPEEAFKASVQGAYYAVQLAKLRKKGRIGKVPYDSHYAVNTFWDIGVNDTMAIWFHQRVGVENRLIDHYENSGEGLEHYIKTLRERGYTYSRHYMPHDARNRSPQTGKTFEQIGRNLGLSDIEIVPRAKGPEEVLEHIESTRAFLSTCWIDEENCSRGIVCLENYRKEWDENLGAYKRSPLHNWASNTADALRTGAVGYKVAAEISPKDLLPEWSEDF